MIFIYTGLFMKHLYYFLLLLGLLLAAGYSCRSKMATAAQPEGYGTKTPHPDGTGKVYMGREIAHVMSASGGSWLDRSTRQLEEDVDKAISLMQLKPDTRVADIGAGTGYYTFRMAKLVPQGRVYAVEVQPDFVAALEARKRQLRAVNVSVVQGSPTGPNLPDSSIDLAIMVDVYHELAYPKEMLQTLYKALKPDGKVLLLEYRAEDPSIPIKELHKMSVAQANKELAASGFVPDRQQQELPIQHFLLYRKKG
jgi:ubiquinone/menaquinone biosynthesis C-methylase UbiE